MSRSRDLANLANNATGLETLTVSDITDLTATATELNYVDGVGSALQTQINGKASLSGATFTGDVAVTKAGNVNLTVEASSTGHSEVYLKNTNRQYNIGLLNDGSKFQLYDVTAGGNRLEVDTSGNATINSGNLVFGTAGKGIDFSAQTTSAVSGISVGAEVLDHYERGTWTPDLQASTSDSTRSAGGSNGGYYVKVGDLVHISGELNIVTSSGNFSGVLKITGLPFTVGTAGSVGVSYYNGWALGSNYGLTLWPYANQTFMYIFHNTSGSTAATQLNNGNRSGNTQTIIFGGSYYTN